MKQHSIPELRSQVAASLIPGGPFRANLISIEKVKSILGKRLDSYKLIGIVGILLSICRFAMSKTRSKES